MSDDIADTRYGSFLGAEDLLGRAAAAERRVRAATAAAAQDFSVPEAFRLDEATRSGMTALLEEWVEAAERALSDFATPGAGEVLPLLRAAGLLNDWTLTDALIGQVRQDQLGKALPHHASADPGRASLINRFIDHPVPAIAEAARDLLLAGHHKGNPETEQQRAPLHLHAKLLWWVASAKREQAGAEADMALDEALCAAVRRAIAAAEAFPNEAADAAAMRFAASIGSAPREVPELLVEALRDRRLALFLALFAHAAQIEYADARALVLDRHPARLVLALHAIGAPRDTIAQIGFLLCEADPNRAIAVLADCVDAVGAVDHAQACAVLAALRLDPAYHAARAALRRSAMAGWGEGGR